MPPLPAFPCLALNCFVLILPALSYLNLPHFALFPPALLHPFLSCLALSRTCLTLSLLPPFTLPCHILPRLVLILPSPFYFTLFCFPPVSFHPVLSCLALLHPAAPCLASPRCSEGFPDHEFASQSLSNEATKNKSHSTRGSATAAFSAS